MSNLYSGSLKPFVFNASDLAFILQQIKFRPLFDANGNAIVNWDGTAPTVETTPGVFVTGLFDGHGALLWDGVSNIDAAGGTIWDGTDINGDLLLNAADLAASALLHFGPSYASTTSSQGLRDVTGLNNNLNLVNSTYGNVDQPFLRTVQSQYALDSHGHVYFSGESNYVTGSDINGTPLANGAAFWANKEFDSAFGGTAGFASNDPTGDGNIDIVIRSKTYTTNYAVTQGPNGEILMDNVVNYAPRMISLLTTTGGVKFDTWANHQVLVTPATQVLYTAGGADTGTEITNWNGVGAIYNAAGDPLWDGVSSFSGTNASGTLVSWTNTDSDTNMGGPINDTALIMTTAERAAAALIAPLAFPGVVYQAVGDELIANTNWDGIGAIYDADGNQLWDGVSSFSVGTNSWTNTDSDNGTDTATTMTAAETTAAAVQAIALFGSSTGSVPNPAAAGHQSTELYYDENGVASVADWGMLKSAGIQDAQARFEGTAGQFWDEESGTWQNEYFIGAQNPGVSPTNGWFTIFGQFFDHGLDFIDKGAQGKSIKITFAKDDPLYGAIGSDGQPATSITISRANVAGFDAEGNPEYLNHTSPFIDQSQTYGSHAKVTEFLREWVKDPVDGTFKAGMNMLNGHTLAESWTKADGTQTHETLPTLNELRAHSVATGRDDITWEDVFNFKGSDQALILDMNPRFDVANLLSSTGFNDNNGDSNVDATDGDGVKNGAETSQAEDVLAAIAWLGNPSNGAIRDGDSFSIVNDDLTLVLGSPLDAGPQNIPAGTYTGANAMMLWVNFANMSVMNTSAIGVSTAGDAGAHIGTIMLASVGDHYIAGDGRVNENFGLTTVHHVFHEEHNFQVENLKGAIAREARSIERGAEGDAGAAEYMAQFQVKEGSTWDAASNNWKVGSETAWNLDVMFNAAKLTVEMEYQHVAIDQYARTVTPDIKEFVGYTSGENPTVSLEYAQSVFRFGHSQLRETIDTIDPTHGLTGKITGYALKLAFLNPDQFAAVGPASIALGMTHQQGNEIDEFITPALNQGLLGLPLDLAAINLARGRDVGIPALNEFRQAVGLRAYDGWADFGANMGHPDNLVNFIAAYSFDGNVDKAAAILSLYNGDYADTAAGIALAQTLGLTQGTMSDADFEASAADYAMNFMNGGDKGVDAIDTWLGGLAEVHVGGGLLGETFNLVFVDQMERIQDGDRFYYLYRLVNQQFADEVAGGQFKDIIERNTGLTHLGGSAFAYNDQYYDLGATADEANTVNNSHKYGAIVDTSGKGVFSDGGNSQSRDGQTVTVRVTDPLTGITTTKQFIRDTRATDPNAPNGGLGIDGTDNSGAESTEVIVATKYDDFIHGRGGDDTIYGDAGNDVIYGDGGIDRLYGGDGKDWLFGGDGAELTDGGAGDDYITGDSSATSAAGVDQLMGGAGNDIIHGGIGIDKLAGNSGDDQIYGEGETDPFTHGGDGNDFIDGGITGDLLYGDNGDDVIVGGADQDALYGGDGDDLLRPGNPSQALGGGPDEVLGGDGVTDNGFDIIDFSDNIASAVGVAFDLLNQANPQVQIDGTTPVPAATQLEGIVGSVNKDTLTGNTGNNWLIGGTGDDKFVGGAGNDVIVGGSIRLDQMIGKYSTAYNHNNNNDAGSATDIAVELFDGAGEQILDWDGTGPIFDEMGNAIWDGVLGGLTPQAAVAKYAFTTQEEMDELYDGASHRVAWNDTLDNSGLLDKANAQLGGVDYDKHFTEMLRTELFKDIKLGDGGADTLSLDTVVFTGNRADYAVQIVTDDGLPTGNIIAYRITDTVANRDGSDLITGIENFQFADGTFNPSNLRNVDPVITSNGGGELGAATVAENTTLATTVVTNDPNVTLQDYVPLQGLTYSIVGGADAALFSIIPSGANAGQLSFIDAPNFENATDADTNNIYDVTVAVTDGLATDTQALSITVTNVNELPTGSIAITAATPNVSNTVDLIALNTLGVDPDSPVTATVDYQWQLSANNGTTWTNIAGATASTLMGQVNRTVRVVSTYTDSLGAKTVSSAEAAVIGTTGANTLTSTSLNDYMVGLGGTDTAVFGAALATESFTLNAAGQLVVTGANGVDTLNSVERGSFGADGTFNLKIGSNVDNVISATTAPELFFGFDGTDTVTYSGATAVTANLATGTATNGDRYYSIENLTGGSGADNLTGDANSNVLNGGGGADTLTGGDGNDTYIVDNVGDVTVETNTSPTQIDTVNSSANHTLGANVENLNLTGAGSISGTGNALNNVITGNAGNNTLTGGLGDDAISGGSAGNDTSVYAGGSANFAFGLNASGQVTLTDLVGSEGSDTLTSIDTVRLNGTNYAVTATGAAGSQFVTGTNGADALDGGAGNDIVIGGAGDDTITYNVNNGGTNNGGRDIIDGGSGTDTFVLVANNQSENFVIYTRAEAISAGFGAGLNAGTEIVVTRQQGTGLATVVAELTDIQEIRVQTGHLFTPQALAGSQFNAGFPGLTTNIAATVGNVADNVKVVGDFTQTTLAYNTITVDGTAGNTTVDISNLTSAHRIVFNTDGAGDTVVGTLRPQDVVNGAATGITAATTIDQASPPLRHSFLSQEWQNLWDKGGFNHSRIDSYQIVDIEDWVAATPTSARAMVSSISEHMSVELYQELAPLAGTVLQAATTQMDHMSLQTSVEPSTSGHKYHGPVDWLSDEDTFSHFVHNLNGHFIP